MPEKKKVVKLPEGASQTLTPEQVSEAVTTKWAPGTIDIVDRLASAEWRSFSSRPRVDTTGYFVVLHWYVKEKEWVALYLQHGAVSAQLTRIFGNKEKETRPIGKYLSSFPRSQRKLLWVKWVMDPPSNGKTPVPFRDVLEAFSAKYNRGEILPFNKVEEQSDVPDNFSLLDY